MFFAIWFVVQFLGFFAYFFLNSTVQNQDFTFFLRLSSLCFIFSGICTMFLIMIKFYLSWRSNEK